MGSQEATSKLRVGKTTVHRVGSTTELLAFDGNPATLLVWGGEKFDAVQALRSGEFSVHMARVNSTKPISMLTCMVGDHQWMLARDSLVASVGERRYVFGLPGFFYGMQLSSSELEQKVETLVSIFARFCAYKDLTQIDGPDDTSISETDPWIAAYNKIQKLTNWREATFGAPKTEPNSTGSNLTPYNKMERAVKTSAVVKLLIHSLLAGALHPSKHIQIGPTNTDIVALPTMWVISDLLNALETDRAAANHALPSTDHDGNAWWRVNVEGVMFLVRVIRAFGAKTATSDAKRKRDDEGSDNRQEKRGGASGSKSGLAGGGGAKWPPCGGRTQVLGCRVGTCGK